MAMKNTVRTILLSSVLLLASCGEKEVSIEEKILMQSFSGLNAAQAYDHVCGGDSLQKMKPTDPAMANLMANTQMLAYRISGFMRERRPEDTIEDAVARLQDTQKLFAAKTEALLKKDGCESEAGKAAANSFRLFTTTGPAEIHVMIDSEVVKQGGTPVLQKMETKEGAQQEPSKADADGSMTVEEIQNADPQPGAPEPSFDQKVKADFLSPGLKSKDE